MKRMEAVDGFILCVAAGLLLCFAPDTFSLFMTALMSVLLAFGYFLGIRAVIRCGIGFSNGRRNIGRARTVQSENPWLAVSRHDAFFAHEVLDMEFQDYKDKIEEQERRQEELLRDIEEDFNEKSIAVRTWQNVVQLIPNSLTGLGILGTFVGLLFGISNIGFSSVTVAIGSLQTLLGGISIAFYTSIAGVILSLIFELLYKMAWNRMTNELARFTKEFHEYVIPDTETQERLAWARFRRRVIGKLNGAGQAAVGENYEE